MHQESLSTPKSQHLRASIERNKEIRHKAWTREPSQGASDLALEIQFESGGSREADCWGLFTTAQAAGKKDRDCRLQQWSR